LAAIFFLCLLSSVGGLTDMTLGLKGVLVAVAVGAILGMAHTG